MLNLEQPRLAAARTPGLSTLPTWSWCPSKAPHQPLSHLPLSEGSAARLPALAPTGEEKEKQIQKPRLSSCAGSWLVADSCVRQHSEAGVRHWVIMLQVESQEVGIRGLTLQEPQCAGGCLPGLRMQSGHTQPETRDLSDLILQSRMSIFFYLEPSFFLFLTASHRQSFLRAFDRDRCTQS